MGSNAPPKDANGNNLRWHQGGNYDSYWEADPDAGNKPPSLLDVANQQNQQNRINEHGAFGESKTFGPDGVTSSLGGPLGGAANDVLGQVGSALGKPLDFSNLPPMASGTQARDQAINAAYGQATSRLDPQWNQRQDQLRTQLLNQGLDEGSQAYQNAMGQFGRDRNDAYSSAMNGAIGQGTEAGRQLFDQSAMQHQQALAEMLQGRSMPLQELAALKGFAPSTSYNQNGGLLEAMLGQGNLDLAKQKLAQEAATGNIDAFANLIAAVNPLKLK